MIKHLVMWKLKDSAEGATKEQNARKIKTDLEALKHKIPQIKHIEVGANFLPSDYSYDVALYSEFETEEDLALYQKHPEHRTAGAFVQKVSESRIVVDYKTK
jgi:hypothetical protein